METLALKPLDFWVMAVFGLLIIGVAIVTASRTRSGDDLFLAGRRLSWFPIGMSLFASNISSTTLIGLSGAAYSWGLAVSNYEWMAAPILVLMALVFVPIYLNARIGTVPEYLELRFDRRARRYFSVLTLVANIVVDTAGTLFAGALVLTTFFPQLDLFSAALILAGIAAAYTAAGGLAAVVYTDVIQGTILLIGAALVTWFSFERIGFDWALLQSSVPADQMSLFLPLDDPNLPWLGTLVGVPVLGFYFWCTNQFIVQRVLGARSVSDARFGVLLAGLLKLPVLYIMVLPGVIATLILPSLDNPDQVFVTLVAEVLPVGLAGLILAALTAALLSSVDSTLNSAAALLTLDFIKPMRPDLGAVATAWIGRSAIVGFMFLASLIAPLIGNFEGLFHYLQTALSYLVPPVAAVFLLGVFSRRAGTHSALATLAGGHALSAILFLLWFQGALQLHFTLVAGLLFVASVLIFTVTTHVRPAVTPTPSAARWRPSLVRPEPPVAFWRDYRLHSLLLILLTIALVWAFA